MLDALLLTLAIQQQDPGATETPPPPKPVSVESIDAATRLIGLEMTDDERRAMVRGVTTNLRRFESMRGRDVANSTPPATVFRPLGAKPAPLQFDPPSLPIVERPEDLGELAYLSISELQSLIFNRKISCRELTDACLARLDQLDPTLHFMITPTTERARARADELDAMLQRGQWLGMLHGIPFGAKDLLAAKGYPTTWGAKPYEAQVIDADASVIQNLEARGAVLVAKLTLGALAMGDVWFGERTRNPWNPETGSSGSSAGSASAVVAGAVPFAIGSETLGSIVSPCTVCGATGLRPTFGVVDTRGAMALSWTMDKLGPICRSAIDCGLVFEAMVADADYPFRAENGGSDIWGMRIGYLESAVERSDDCQAAMSVLKNLGAELVPFTLPDFPVGELLVILNAEAACAFDELTRSGDDEKLVRQDARAWPNSFRTARLIPAVEYIRAMRLRTELMHAVEKAFESADVDVYLHPSHGNASLATTNLTGQPCFVAPSSFRQNGTPRSISFTARNYHEAALLRVARAWQAVTESHRKRPELDR